MCGGGDVGKTIIYINIGAHQIFTQKLYNSSIIVISTYQEMMLSPPRMCMACLPSAQLPKLEVGQEHSAPESMLLSQQAVQLLHPVKTESSVVQLLNYSGHS